MSRTRNSIYNMFFGVLGKIITLIIQFIVRTVFIHYLGVEYLGIGGLFSNILTCLSLAELGIGTAITFSLYEPINSNDTEKIAILMRIFKISYIFIGSFVFVAGIFLTPFLSFFVKEMPDIPDISTIYILYVINTAISYFFSYKSTYIIAQQKSYITTNNNNLIKIISSGVQIAILVLTQNYIFYLIIQLVGTFVTNLRITLIANRIYPELRIRTRAKLDSKTQSVIIQNIRAMIFHKIGTIVVFATDNILLSKLFGVVIVGLYSNYSMVIAALESLIGLFFTSITASVGNLRVDSDIKHQKDIYYILLFTNFAIYLVSTSVLSVAINPFVEVWAGFDYIMPLNCVIFIVVNFYLKGMRQIATVFNASYGLVPYYKYLPIFESAINILVSIIAGKVFGPVGIFVGTTVSTLTTCFWVEPFILFKYGFKSEINTYLRRYVLYTLITIASIGESILLCFALSFTGIVRLIVSVVVSFSMSITLLIVFFHDTGEFKYMKNLVFKIFNELFFKKIKGI